MTSKAPESHARVDAPTSKPTYRLTGDNAEAIALVRTYLDGTELDWPGEFHLNIHVGDSNPFPRDNRDIYRQPGCTMQAGPDADTVYIRWEFSPAAAVVHPTRPEADIWFSPEAVTKIAYAERSFLLIVLLFVLRRLGWYHVHGATIVDPKGRGWLIAGNSNCGKSTTTALVASHGWPIGTDDIGFLAERDGKVVSMGVRTRIALRPGGVELLGASGGLSLGARNKLGYLPEELGGSWAPVVTPEIIAFPSIGEKTKLTPSAPRETLSAMVQWSNWVLYEPAFSQEYLDVLGAVARQSRCYNLTLGPDLFENPNLLQDLVP